MPLQKFIFRPGINKEGTDYSNDGGWVDANLVRFRKGLPEKIGGWAKNTLNTFQSTGRALHAWVTLAGTKLLGLGTTWKYYVLDGDSFYDITPLRSTTSAGDVTSPQGTPASKLLLESAEVYCRQASPQAPRGAI